MVYILKLPLWYQILVAIIGLIGYFKYIPIENENIKNESDHPDDQISLKNKQ
jgi:hypothetical protein